jgi:hypothetical protein
MSFFSNIGRSIRGLGSTLGKHIHGLAKGGNSILENALKIGERAQGILAGAKEIPLLSPLRGAIETAERGLSSIRKGAEVVRGIGRGVEMGAGQLSGMVPGGQVAGLRNLAQSGLDTRSALLDLRRILGR